MRFNIVILSVVLSFFGASAWAQTNVETYGVIYKTIDGKDLQMDIQRPQPLGVPKPIIVFLCGNGWGYERTINRESFWYALDLANKHGYVAATADYSSSAQNSEIWSIVVDRKVRTFPRAPIFRGVSEYLPLRDRSL